jgi:K+-transporting ATPase ATPase C chain
MSEIIKEFKNSLIIFGVMVLILGLVYPLAVTSVSQVLFPYQANGQMITVNGNVVGSELIGQNFNSSKYFHGRPSAIDYNASTSGGSNYGPTNKKLVDRINESLNEIRAENKLSENTLIPADLVLASGSGLDRYISAESALIQVTRIAKERNISESIIKDLIDKNMEIPFPMTGKPVVNVLKLNIALDGIH